MIINDEMTAVRYENLGSGKVGLWFSKWGKIKSDESNRNIVELQIKEDMEKLFQCVINGRKFRDLRVAISTDWNSLEKVAGPAYDKYLNLRKDDFYKESEFKYARYCRKIEFI